MKVTLNSRTIVGPQHTQAAAFAGEWVPEEPLEVDWQESPSARCVLDIEIPPDRPFILRGAVEPVDGHDARSHLEIDLRDNLGMPPYCGDDPDGSERIAS